MAKAPKRSRPGRRHERKSETWFPLRRPALLAALGLTGWAPAGAAGFPPTLDLSDLDGTNGFRIDGVAAADGSGISVSSAGDVNGDGLADLLIGAFGNDSGGAPFGACYVVFGRNTAQTGPFPASVNLSTLDGTNGFRLATFAPDNDVGFALRHVAVSSAGISMAMGSRTSLSGTTTPTAPTRPTPAVPTATSKRAMWSSGETPPRLAPFRRASTSFLLLSMARTAFA